MQKTLALVGAVTVLFLIALGAINAMDRFAISLKAQPLRTEAINADREGQEGGRFYERE